MSREYGFLRPKERALIDASDPAEIHNARDVKYRLKHGPASPTGLREAVTAFHADLRRVQSYHREQRNQPGGSYDWDDHILPLVQAELAELHAYLGHLLDRAEQDTLGLVRDEVGSEFATPLREGLDALAKADRGAIGPREIVATRREVEAGNDALAADLAELNARRRGLLALLRDRELRKIFEWLEEHPGEELPDRKKKGNLWKWWAGKRLGADLGLVEEGVWFYELSDRGEKVATALENLEESEFISEFGGEREWDEAALHLLEQHYPTERWEQE